MVLMRSGYAMRCVHAGRAAAPEQALLPMHLPVQIPAPLMALPESAGRFPKTRGHAARPGSGPAGETCGSCAQYRSVQGGARSHPKCELARSRWTHGPGSDIRKCDPACERRSSKS